MSASASILYLRLDADYDTVWYSASALSNRDAVAQAILTRLNLFQGEWWENLNDGTPMFQQILGQRATPNGLATMATALAGRVSGTPYVSAVLDPFVSYNPATRKLIFTCIAQTSFGNVPISYSPGAVAGANG